MKGNERQEIVNHILDHSATSLVAIILSQLEILEQNNSLKSELCKPLVKEAIYNHFKYLTKLLSGTVVNFNNEREG